MQFQPCLRGESAVTDKTPFARILPVVLALAPIGFLFGVLAGQADWSAWGVLAMALFGFTGSGQFTYLGFAHPDNAQMEYLAVFLIILGINLRYIPMSMSASARLSGGPLIKAALAHWLADESYATERAPDGTRQRAVIRLMVVALWALSTVCGVLLSGALPPAAQSILSGMTFPISAILILLSIDNILAYLTREQNASAQPFFKRIRGRELRATVACVGASLLCIAVIGAEYFWLPAIALCYFILARDGGGESAHG